MSYTVLGGGLSGLSAAYYLLKKSPKLPITLIESSNRVGGWIKSTKQENGTIFEQAARTIRPRYESGLNTLKLIEEIGLSNEIIPITSSHPAVRNRMIFVDNKLHTLPSTIGALFKQQQPFSKSLFQQLLQDIRTEKKISSDEPIYDFVSRRFGTEIADYLISPMICGICAGNSKEISVKFLLENLFQYEQTYGNVYKGILADAFSKKSKLVYDTNLARRAKNESWNIYGFKNGLETLPKTLLQYISNNRVNIQLETVCTELDVRKNEVILNCSGNKNNFITNKLISAVPAEILSRLIENQHPQLSALLQKIKSVTVIVINFEFDQNIIPKPGFGFLVPPKENRKILGVIYDSCCFSVHSNSVLTVMMGGHWYEKYFQTDWSDDRLVDIALGELRDILKTDAEPVGVKVNVLRKCIPQYVVGHSDNLTQINDYIKKNDLPLYLCGASYYGVGVNDVILSAKKIIEKM